MFRNLIIKIKSALAPKGIVGPHMSQYQWDKEFSGNKWDYLADESQKEHYYLIGEMYRKHCSGDILDIGCGTGLLYEYLSESINLRAEQFTGIDISQVAIKEACAIHPHVDFKVLNYETELIDARFGTIIFNETLYYFNHAGKTLRKCIDENLLPGGKIIISMCYHERHEQIWRYIDARYHVADTVTCGNYDGISWTVKVIEAK